MKTMTDRQALFKKTRAKRESKARVHESRSGSPFLRLEVNTLDFPLTPVTPGDGTPAETALAVAAPATLEAAVLQDEPSTVMLELTPLQQQAIDLFLMGKTQAEVGLALNRTDRTM